MSYNWILLAYVSVICTSSILFDQTTHPLVLVIIAAVYMLVHFAEKRIFLPTVFEMGLLVAFHWLSQMDWCLPLYLAQMGKHFYKIRNLNSASAVSVLYTLTYALVSFSYMPYSPYGIVAVLFSSVSCLIFAVLFYRYIHTIENHARQLKNEKKHLSTHDNLTGLYNYEECHRQLTQLVEAQAAIVLVLIDCKDLKSLNTTNGFHGVNRILQQAAQLLRIMFPEALIISRYGGDEFAIVLEANRPQKVMNTISQQLAYEFPKLTGIEINYGMAFYPNDGLSKDDLIFNAEQSLYDMKRESWLKREEHMLRSEKLRVVGELASGMAHEIRNPLTTIKGFLQLSRADNFNVRPWYDLIMDEITRMSMLTAEFLQFSKPHAMQFKVHSIQNCIQRVISLLDSEASRLGHSIRFDDHPEPVYILMDQDKILQLLLNLIKNALEAMPDQGLVHIRLLSKNNQATFEIADTGKGIPETELDKIFVPFYTTKDSGTGLGLSICHKIVQDHQGTMEVESVLDKGTKFIITIPTASPDHSPAAVVSNGMHVC
ncbi:ATP-binding protein [Paenibacillus xerothermodurans]|uniref:histidine kinase n=1 Tax=Paenibacillus xerothermodurans TaxID=1977292 RepID=A0A2W1P698_PAEXE|nr:ATP-binding protein [Paenibacillus xerothermodurans]PZE22588.1 diguanylate cyclase [Paenibacillus xerothermodurans]